MIQELLKKNREVISYAIIGVLCVCIDFVTYTTLCHFGLEYIIANVIGISAGILSSFTLNRIFTFRVKSHSLRRFLIFIMVGLFGMGISSGMLILLIEFLHTNELIAKVISIIFVGVMQFLMNKFITFKDNE